MGTRHCVKRERGSNYIEYTSTILNLATLGFKSLAHTKLHVMMYHVAQQRFQAILQSGLNSPGLA